ncbi:MAG: hypothetical protein M3Y12_00350 [Bacteroidota bacterium]|nr:hypothetical protein [Bacteroidota bacterium]
MAHPSADTSALARIWLLLEHHRPQQAARRARQCLAANSALVHQWRGQLLRQRCQPHQAARHLTEALIPVLQ